MGRAGKVYGPGSVQVCDEVWHRVMKGNAWMEWYIYTTFAEIRYPSVLEQTSGLSQSSLAERSVGF